MTGLLMALLLAGACVGFGLWQRNSHKEENAADQAESACRDFVKDRLTAPSTARFSDERWSRSGDRFTVTATLESESSLGATIRSTYTCEVRLVGDTWELINLIGLPG